MHTTTGSSTPQAHSRCPPGSSQGCKPGPQGLPRVIQDSTPFHAHLTPPATRLKQTSSSPFHPKAPPGTFPSAQSRRELSAPPSAPTQEPITSGFQPHSPPGLRAHQPLTRTVPLPSLSLSLPVKKGSHSAISSLTHASKLEQADHTLSQYARPPGSVLTHLGHPPPPLLVSHPACFPPSRALALQYEVQAVVSKVSVSPLL